MIEKIKKSLNHELIGVFDRLLENARPILMPKSSCKILTTGPIDMPAASAN